MTALDVLLAAAVLASAVATLVVPRRAAGATLFLVLGLLLVLVWGRLGAPDVALAEATIASGVTGALLVQALTARAPRGDGTRGDGTQGTGAAGGTGRVRSARRAGAALGLAVAAVVGVLLGRVLLTAAREGEGPGRLGEQALAAGTVVPHPVTGVLLDLRALDTLLEIAVLAAAVLAALALQRDGTLAAVRVRPDTRPLLRAFVTLAVPLVLLLVGWLLVAGSTRPGGAFQAGALLTGAVLLLVLTGRVPHDGRWLRPVVVGGLAAFLLVAAGTRLAAGAWLGSSPPWGAGLVLALEAALVPAIGVGLAVLFLAARRDTSAPPTPPAGHR
ncbi:MnhB domain-containing protein [Cellulomonas phragmiteti]|uniref:Sodium:proton antiporter n=1 Tax=Cellulomonas phragmiteti TaxID=478780 RepID=A0ABQ4DME7_9CELL|nr:MnhB domain-containing protein [Cellulomonas phragmiteti]GIG40527.1 sodium:proton antiporter [Cellulomonas phragmiteti]